MLTWTRCPSQGQHALWEVTQVPFLLALATPGPGTLSVALGTGASQPLAPSPLHNGKISWGLGKMGPSCSRPSEASSKAHILSTLRPRPLGCD